MTIHSGSWCCRELRMAGAKKVKPGKAGQVKRRWNTERKKGRIWISALVKSCKKSLLAQACAMAAVQPRKQTQSLEPWNSFDYLPVNRTKQCQAQDCTQTKQRSLWVRDFFIYLTALWYIFSCICITEWDRRLSIEQFSISWASGAACRLTFSQGYNKAI